MKLKYRILEKLHSVSNTGIDHNGRSFFNAQNKGENKA